MTSAEAVAIAERYLAAEGVSHGPMRFTRFRTGTECEPEYRPPPHWSVYFWYGEPLADPPDSIAETCLCVTVDDVFGTAQLIWWM
jgi:hypothetical protein